MFEITMSGPGKNAIGTDMMNFLLDKFTEADGRPVLLTGTGNAFSAGLNLKELAQLDADGMAEFLRKLVKTCATVYRYPGPTVAYVNGHAIAGGCVLAMCCDQRIGTDDPRARIGLNEVALGLRFPPVILSIVRSRIPAHRIEEVVLGARLYPPAAAYQRGLLNEVCEDGHRSARLALEALANHPAEAYAGTKADLCKAVEAVDEPAERRYSEEVLPFWTSPDVKARINAALPGKQNA